MALLDKPRWAFWGPKPVSTKGTDKAFAAGDAIFRRTGVNQHLKDAVKRSILNERAQQR